jgi:hypothetical protein
LRREGGQGWLLLLLLLLLLLAQRGYLPHAAQAAHLCQPELLMPTVPPQHSGHHWLCQQLLQAKQEVHCCVVLLILLCLNRRFPERPQVAWVSEELQHLLCWFLPRTACCCC